MPHLYEVLQARVAEWRSSGYPSDYPAIAEILEFAVANEISGLRFLRAPQLRALETYWYLRLVEQTPHIFQLYQDLFLKRAELLNALGISNEAFEEADFDLDSLLRSIRSDNNFVHKYRLEALRESLGLGYPSYIFALAMGAGKTILIGTIIATEFAMALEYLDGPFVQNALVFAPGKTIIESLRELTEIPFVKILTPRLLKPFAASLKLTFTRDGEKDLPIIRGSNFNVVVTNTEKIRIQRPTLRKHQTWSQFEYLERQRQEEEVANLRLQAIASLPHLAIFSDEAHHTYGQALDRDLKKVRRTVDYLHEKTNLICVVNTTGTPYFQRQSLKDVVIWYGLSEGIRDNILKELAGNVYAYSFDDDSTDAFLREIIQDFYENYGTVRLPNGAQAKLAIYFPQNDDLNELRPVLEQILINLGVPTSVILKNTSESTKNEIDAFNRLNDPASPHRVILLVNKGTEGWNCPSLFACALARRIHSSNNFVLQAATRCLRQVPGNQYTARVYLSMDNRTTLDRELQETYGENITDLGNIQQNSRTVKLVLRKWDIPPVVIQQRRRRVVPNVESQSALLSLSMPESIKRPSMIRQVYDLEEIQGSAGILQQIEEEEISLESAVISIYHAAVELAAIYRLEVGDVYSKLRQIYNSVVIPENHLSALAQQIEKQTSGYTQIEELIEVALALVKLDGFNAEKSEDEVVYTTEITYPVSREHLLLSWDKVKDLNFQDLGFHYTPYNFDSNPEKDFFTQMLRALDTEVSEVEDIYYTGALTDPNKTDFIVEYKGEDNKWHKYSPDFIIRKKNGRCLIVEIKALFRKDDVIDGELGRKAMALRQWIDLNPDILHYEMIFADRDVVNCAPVSGQGR